MGYMGRTFFLSAAAFLFFSVLIRIPAVASETLETSTGFDGHLGYRGHAVYARPSFSCGASFRRMADGTFEVMGGLNSGVLVAGHLSDSGLASEVRNPGCSALGRLTERTGFRADLRSFSDSRFGICAALPGGRAGAAWERRNEGEFGLLWAVPVSGRRWTWELLCESGRLGPSSTDDSWYPDEAATGEGDLSLAASRIRCRSRGRDFSATMLASASRCFRPGVSTALSARISTGPWLVRTRVVYASEFFRDAGGERAEGPVGAALDLKYAPLRGLQCDVDYEIRLDSCFLAPSVWEDEGKSRLGWRFARWRILSTVDWNAVAVRVTNDSDIPYVRSVGMTCEYTTSRLDLCLGLRYGPEGIWLVDFDAAYDPSGPWETTFGTSMEINDSGVPTADVGLDWKLRMETNVLKISMDFGDLLRDWEHGPRNAGDFDLSIRWITVFE